MFSIDKQFNNTLLIDNSILCTTFTVNLEFMPSEYVSEEHMEIAISRLFFMLDEQIDQGMWINFESPLADQLRSDFKVKLLNLPDDPFDQMIAAALAFKIQAITSPTLDVLTITISNTNNLNVKNKLSYDDCSVLLHGSHKFDKWYNDPLPVVDYNMNFFPTWDELSLEFMSTDNEEPTTSTVVQIGRPGWRPKIIPGDKDDAEE